MDSSLRRDREQKIGLYAQARVREAWLVDVTAGTVTVHRDPWGVSYRTVTLTPATTLSRRLPSPT